ncbi:MAG: hypothetical protein KDB21_19605, partial [Acidimicrobiales bacterium]|nr:hypothetical protein [Acidimicrobiales bacterium]
STGLDGLGAFREPRAAVTPTPHHAADATMPIADVTLDGVAVPADGVLAAPGTPGVAERLERALQHATVAVAVMGVGACRAIFEKTVAYAKERVQYGQPIGGFQALKHRMADMYLALERANALCWFAVLAIAEDDPRRAEAASLAKAAVGDCQRLIVQDGLQLHGGIGFTWEHDLHFLLKRARSCGALFGNAVHHRARLAALLELDAAGGALVEVAR